MTSKDIVKALLTIRGLSQRELADRMGITQSNITGYINRTKGELKVNVFVKLLRAMDCELVVRSRLKDHTEWVLTEESSAPVTEEVKAVEEPAPKKSGWRIPLV